MIPWKKQWKHKIGLKKIWQGQQTLKNIMRKKELTTKKNLK
jgi:hypothetical protein